MIGEGILYCCLARRNIAIKTEANINAAGCNFNSYIRRAVRFVGGCIYFCSFWLYKKPYSLYKYYLEYSFDLDSLCLFYSLTILSLILIMKARSILSQAYEVFLLLMKCSICFMWLRNNLCVCLSVHFCLIFRGPRVWPVHHSTHHRYYPAGHGIPRPLLPHCVQAQLHQPQHFLWWERFHCGWHLLWARSSSDQRWQVRERYLCHIVVQQTKCMIMLKKGLNLD